MKKLDISFIPDQFVFFWWLSKVSKNYEALIISPDQIYIFGGTSPWDFYRHLMIYVKHDNRLMTVKEYKYILSMPPDTSTSSSD